MRDTEIDRQQQWLSELQSKWSEGVVLVRAKQRSGGVHMQQHHHEQSYVRSHEKKVLERLVKIEF